MARRKWDFVLYEDNDEKIVFRFYPKHTHVHSFNENPPKTWEEVYKVYYSWKIFHYYKPDEYDNGFSEDLIDLGCDECSEVVNLHHGIRYVLDKKEPEPIDLISFGQPASEWEIEYKKNEFPNCPELNSEYLNIRVWKLGYGTGYRFKLDIDKAKEFADFIERYNQYALEHGEEI